MLVAENEDDLQRLLHQFNLVAKSFNMVICVSKSKCMTTSKTPLRCKFEVGSIIQQEMRFKYLGIELSSYGDVEAEVRKQTTRATKIAGCLNAIIWRDMNIGIKAKSRIYKTAMRPIMTSTAETRLKTAKTKRLLKTTKTKVLRGIAGKILLNRETSENIRRTCGIEEDINCWVLKRKKQFNEHISRMEKKRIVRIARDKSPTGRRSI